ncbi:MAG: PolC-type DNA polymerase III [Clostridia bacterium]|nr:PolC-type DNA polymerase III [Clostridia bacterium]
MSKMTLAARFPKYSASDELINFMSNVVTATRVDKELRIIEVDILSESLIPKAILYRIEQEILVAYDLNRMRIYPQYPSNLFNSSYVDEIIKETCREASIGKGFFEDYSLECTREKILIKVPFIQGGIDLLGVGNTAKIIEKIIQREFDLNIPVSIVQREDYARNIKMFEEEKLSFLKKALDLQSSAKKEKIKEESKEDIHLNDYKKTNSFVEAEAVVERNGDIIHCGNTYFDVSVKEYVTGGEFEIDKVVPIRNITYEMHDIVVLGSVFDVSDRSFRGKNGSMTTINIGLTDKDSSIFVKSIVKEELAKEVLSCFKIGESYAIRGNVKINEKDGETYIDYLDVYKINSLKRIDNAPEKRVELHLHTMMSEMDSTIDPTEIVKLAKSWGHKAVAITDHGNVQAFPPVMLAAEKAGMNIIYGMEAYFVNDIEARSGGSNTSKVVYGNLNCDLTDEFCVFDIETTGLSAEEDRITEIGAIIIKDGQVVDRYNTFVNPEKTIPKNIIELTGITNEMVKDARLINEVLPEFLSFINGRILVAHNANFDIGFIRAASRRLAIDFNPTYIDTLALSRYINPDLKKHKLNVLADYYKLGNFNHHRACDDAEMLGQILSCMFNKLEYEGISSVKELLSATLHESDKIDLKKLETYHQIILVKNRIGLKNLYKLVSEGFIKKENFYKKPRVLKSRLNELREGLIIGSACEAGELFKGIIDGLDDEQLEEIASFYDYLEIQPICNNMFLVHEGQATVEDLKRYNKKIIEIGEKLNKLVVATCDAHFINKEDEIGRKILLSYKKMKDADKDTGIYFRTTDEMLKEFEYLGKEKAYEIVVTNTNLIADMIQYDDIRPFPKGTFTPKMDGAEEKLQKMCWERAKKMYEFNGEVPNVVSERLSKELSSIIQNGFAVLYVIAQMLVEYSESLGYLVGSRGSVGSSFVATMAGISEVNPLQPHYRCPNCCYSEFITDGSVGSGFDLPDKNCPHCNTKMYQDGHDIPFETFLGFKGDKSPDIDLNFSGVVQGEVHKYTEKLFGKENVFRAGTVGAIATKTAIGYILKYRDEHKYNVNQAEIQRIAGMCTGVKRTTGQHPGGIVVVPKEYEIYDFCPVQHPANDASTGIITTHFTFEYLHDTLLKLDELGHDMPTKYKMIEKYTNTSVLDVPMNDPQVYELFLSTKPLGSEDLLKDLKCKVGTYGLPEFGTKFVQQMLVDSKPRNFSDLLQISGLSHGTDVWLGNAQDLIKAGTCTISNVVGTRDSIMLYLIYNGLEKGIAFKIMEDVRKGKGLTAEFEKTMRDNKIPDWYISSCKKIKYMFPKAHAAAYVISAIRLGWYKVHRPLEFYAAYLSVAPGGFEASMVANGKSGILFRIDEIEKKGNDATAKEKETVVALQIAYECLARGIEFLPVDFTKSDSFNFLPENGKIRLPFSSIEGIGENAAIKIKEARESNEVFSVEDFQQKTMLTKAVMEILENNHVFDNLAKTNQISLFDML